MNTRNKVTQATRRQLVTFSAVGSLALSSALLVACGGGGVGGAGTGSVNFSAGAVTGKGSTIVNGVRFDDSAIEKSAIEDANDDNTKSQVNHVSDDVKVGMEVEIEHGAVICPTATGDQSSTAAIAGCVAAGTTPTSTATKISFGGNSMQGAISAVSASGFTLFGQSVTLTAATVISGGPLLGGQVVEVHGSYDATSKTLTATRVEVKVADLLAAQTAGLVLRVRGTLVVTGAATATIGGLVVDLNGQSTTGLDGTVVRALLSYDTTPKVLGFKSGVRKLDNHKGASAELEGAVEGLKTDATTGTSTSGDVTFTLGGAVVRIKASALATLRPVPADLANGVRVEVEGSVDATSGELVAAKLKFKKAEEDTTGLAMELHGNVERVDTLNKTVTVRGVIVTFNTITWVNSSALMNTVQKAMPQVLTRVEIKAQSVGGVITAKSIKLDK
jgi:hypothetical protein